MCVSTMPATNAVKQFDVVTFFQRSNGCAGGRLGQVQLAGGLGDMLLVGDRGKDPELFERHGMIIP